MSNYLTFTEALHFIDEAWSMNALDHYVHSVGFDVCIPGVSADRVRHDVDSFLATLDRDIDPDSISIVPDSTDSPPLNVVQLIIKLGV